MTTNSLNGLAAQYAQHLKSIPFTDSLDDGSHEPGKQSVYELQFDLTRGTQIETFWYAGRTKSPKTRLSGHKSNFRNARATINVGISELFTDELYEVTSVELSFRVIEGGLSMAEAKEAEKGHSAYLRSLYGDTVLTRPHGSGKR